MKKIILNFVLLFAISVFAFGQDTKKTNFYNNTIISETENITISAKNPVSKFNYSKFELIIENNSDYFLMFKQSECTFKFASKEKNPKEKRRPKIIRPGRKISPTLKVSGGTGFLVDEFEFIPAGISRFSSDGTLVEAPDFHLPPNKNEFIFGNFKMRMLKIKKETKETAVQFRCTYLGDKIALVSPVNAVLKTKNGKEWANYKSNSKTKILIKGDDIKMTLIFRIPGKIVDMQFAEMDILWKNTFSEAKTIPIKFNSAKIKLNTEKTTAKNK